MYILYLDESGMHAEARYFVLAGLAVFEREIHWYAQDVDLLQKRYFPSIPEPIEFHASELHKPPKSTPPPFDALAPEQRWQLVADVYEIIRERRGVVFGVAIEKAWIAPRKEDPYARAFEDLTSRFDLFVRRYNTTLVSQNPQSTDEQRGLIAVAESSYRRNLEVLGERFRGGSTRWGGLHAIADVPFFLPSRNTRLLQLADFCSNAIYSRYNDSNTRHFDKIASRFDRGDDGRIHGLSHLTSDYRCQCPGCLSRQQSAGRQVQ
jgi:uncharacterized protein DUF3800